MESRLKNIRLCLETERERLVRELEAYSNRTTDGRGIDAFGDSGDVAAKLYEDEKRLALSQSITDRLRDIEHALMKFENGTYGYCDVCGKDIPLGRLEAIPYASLCLNCGRSRKKVQSIPVSMK